MRKVKTPRNAKGSQNLRARPTTTADAVNAGIPAKTVRNIPRGHIVRGVRDMNRIGWEPWEEAVGDMLRMLDEQRLDRANRFYGALERVNRLMETARQRGEEAEEALAYSQSLMDNMRDILMTTSPQGTITQVNPATERITGYSAKKLLRKPFAKFFADPERAQAGLEQVLREGEVSDYELTLVTKDGREVSVSYNATALRDASGRITGILGSARDMTRINKLMNEMQATSEELEANYEELQATSEELEATNEEMQATMEELETANAKRQTLMNSMRDILMTTDPAGVITEVNPATERISGYSREELIKQPFRQFFTEPDRAQAGIEQVIREGEVADYELTVVTKDRRQVPVSYNATVLRDHTGRITAVLGSARDMTRTTKLLSDLRATTAEAERLSAYRQSLMDAMLNILLATDPSGTIVLVNPAAERISGYSAEELLDKPFANFFTDRKRAQAGIEQVLAEGGVSDYELTLVAKDRRQVPVSYNATVMRDPEGRIIRVVGSAQDMTRVNKLMNELQATNTKIKRAEEDTSAVNRDLETLLHVTSHDLKEPLRAIENFSRMVNDQYADQLDERGQDFLKRVVLGSERMSHLIDDITALSRAQRIEPPTEEVEGEAIVREALARLESRIKETEAQVQVAKDLPRLRADKTWATEAVYNLVANALKFTREGVAPEVEIAPYQPAEGEPVGVGIVVRDRGPGVAPEHADRIFELFQRAVAREVEGTGAGLAIVRQIARRHGGRAWVRPREGGGSEFIITFGT
ncbi:MAG: PAS domain S-box protein [Anaerolineae bacterium]